jgi:hypothetical protein
MSSNNEVPKDAVHNVSDGKAVWIVSHDLDTYEMLSLALKRDFGIKSISSFFLEDENGKRQFAGLRFTEFLGRRVHGYYCPASALILCGDLDKNEQQLLKGLTIVQLVPDFHGYKSICRIMGGILSNENITAKALYTDDALAQHLAEEHLLNLLGLFFSVPNLPNNPVPPTISGPTLQEHIRKSKLLLQEDAIFKSLRELGITYSIMKASDSLFGLDKIRSATSSGRIN